jgi:enamine deaminase RidA (YjgF/YER057c/UK114 family)
MADVELRGLTPEGWQRGAGFSHGMSSRGGRHLSIAGQTAHENGSGVVSDDLAAQWDQSLGNVVAVVEAAGGGAQHVAELTVFVTSMSEYHESGAALVEPWRRHFGKHFPAITLIGVTALIEERAKIEIKGTAFIPE